MKKVLAIIPARAGSKRVVKKNIKNFCGKPLVTWTIEQSLRCDFITDVIVSTDDPEVIKIARENGVKVPWIRPPELSTDSASSAEVCIHALDWYENNFSEVAGVILLQPTSPLRQDIEIEKGVDLYFKNNKSTVLAVSNAQSHPRWCFKIVNNRLEPYIDMSGFKLRSQELDSAYNLTGSFYMISGQTLRSQRNFVNPGAVPLLIEDQFSSIDIDTEDDWLLAEYVFKNRFSNEA